MTWWVLARCGLFPWEEIVWIREPEQARMEVLAAMAGVLPSQSQAAKNGFRGPVPEGLELWGTKLTTFWCWRVGAPLTRPVIGKKRRKTDQWVKFREGMGLPVSPRVRRDVASGSNCVTILSSLE